MSIKYYRLAKDEELPDEFCAVRDVDGEPSEYVFYVPESDAAKLRELVKRYHQLVTGTDELWSWQSVYEQLRELGIEVGEAGGD